MRDYIINEERRLNREMRNRICEVFGELAWEVSQLFSEKPEQVANRLAVEALHPGWSVKV